MLNQTVLVGRLVREPEVKELEDGKKVSNMTLAIPRSYKNENGEYETDFVDCVLWNGVAQSTAEYCHQGDVLGVKGRIQTDTYETEDGTKKKVTQVIAEKISFLSSHSKDREESEVEKASEKELEV